MGRMKPESKSRKEKQRKGTRQPWDWVCPGLGWQLPKLGFMRARSMDFRTGSEFFGGGCSRGGLHHEEILPKRLGRAVALVRILFEAFEDDVVERGSVTRIRKLEWFRFVID